MTEVLCSRSIKFLRFFKKKKCIKNGSGKCISLKHKQSKSAHQLGQKGSMWVLHHKNGDENIKVGTPQLQRYRIFNYVLTTGDVSSSNALRQSDEERLSSEYH